MNFKELRQFVGYQNGVPQTQRDMMSAIGRAGHDSGVSWSNWETGRHTPDTDSLKLIAKAFNVTVVITPDGNIDLEKQ